MSTLVITSCTGRKAVVRPDELQLEDFQNPIRFREREKSLTDWMRPAGLMYTGTQHVRVMDGVMLWRCTLGPNVLKLSIVSAGYGLVAEDQLVAPYNVTFNDMPPREVAAWAERRSIPEDLRRKVRGHRLVIFLLGDKYLHAIRPPVESAPGQRFIFLAPRSAVSMLRTAGVTVVPAGRAEAVRYREGIVALKGKMFLLFAQAVAQEGSVVLESVIHEDSSRSFLTALHTGCNALD